MPVNDCINTIICGNIMDVLPPIPAETFNCVVTSPPYWGLRAYKTTPVIWGGQKDCRHSWQATPPRRNRSEKDATTAKQKSMKGSYYEAQGGQFCSLCSAWRGELGLEPTIELYIEHLMMVFSELKRVLRKDGVCFVNIGDTYNAGRTGGWAGGKHGISKPDNAPNQSGCNAPNVLAKSLCNIPEKFCLAMEKQGWIKRCNIIWAKGFSFANNLCPQCGLEVQYSGSCMPDSAKDRPNHNGFEWVYMFTKSKKYWYEQQYEEYNYDGRQDTLLKPTDKYPTGKYPPKTSPAKIDRGEPMERWPNPLGRTIRNVWAINPQPFPEAHFATFPEALVEKCLKMGCPEFVCKKCGKARSKIYDVKPMEIKRSNWGEQAGNRTAPSGTMTKPREATEIGLTDCGCNAGWKSGLALDPFAGSCTTAVVAYELKRNYTMIELSKEYCKMGRNRLNHQKEQYGLLE